MKCGFVHNPAVNSSCEASPNRLACPHHATNPFLLAHPAPDDPTGTFSGPASHTKCDMQIRPKIGCQTVARGRFVNASSVPLDHAALARPPLARPPLSHTEPATADAQNPIRHGTYAGCQTLAACLPLLPPSSPLLTSLSQKAAVKSSALSIFRRIAFRFRLVSGFCGSRT